MRTQTRRSPIGLFVVTFALLAATLAAEAQGPGKVWHIGVLTGGVPRSAAPVKVLEQRLGELGYVEGRPKRTADSRARAPAAPRSPREELTPRTALRLLVT